MRKRKMAERRGRRQRVRSLFIELVRGSDGQELVEYSLLVSLVSLVAAATVVSLGATIGGVFQIVSTGMQQ